ncbi:MAG TPA: DUF1579 family protein [Polyangia bacterium]|jgi:hypothetical protein|nr:DUF1579 family protein [Polyangia bacterium]
MTKLASIVITGTLFSGAIALCAHAADKAPAPAAAPAAAAAPAGPPKAAPEVDALFKGYEGSYKCDSTFPAGAMGPGSPESKGKSTVKIKKEAGGFWYKGDYKLGKTKTMPAIEATFLLGYDGAAKAPVSVSYDNMGSYWLEHAPGATADKIVFVGDGSMMSMKMKVRETMTMKDAKTVEHTFEVDMGKGYQPFGTDVCKK